MIYERKREEKRKIAGEQSVSWGIGHVPHCHFERSREIRLAMVQDFTLETRFLRLGRNDIVCPVFSSLFDFTQDKLHRGISFTYYINHTNRH